MSELRGGFQGRDINEGFQALAGVRNWDDLDGLIETLPVLSSPVFHAELRRFRQERADELGSERANFMAIYDALFLRLHQRAYLEHIKAARSQGARTTPPIGPLYAPPFFLALVSLLNGQLPLQEGPCYDPASDAVALAAELNSLLGRTIELPAYQPTAGSLWCAMILACANCGSPRLGIRAYFIDLLQAPALLEPLKEKHINADLCPQCSAQVVAPKRIWVQERPNPRDPLASLSCLLFANPSELIYLAPPGTIRDAAYDRVLEIRAEILMRQLSWSPPQAVGNRANSGSFSLVIVYSPDELAARIQATTVASPALPASYLDFVSNMARHLASGITPVYNVIEIIREQIPKSGRIGL